MVTAHFNEKIMEISVKELQEIQKEYYEKGANDKGKKMFLEIDGLNFAIIHVINRKLAQGDAIEIFLMINGEELFITETAKEFRLEESIEKIKESLFNKFWSEVFKRASWNERVRH